MKLYMRLSFFVLLLVMVSKVYSQLAPGFCIGKPRWNNHPTDCEKYVQCLANQAFIGECPAGLYWDNSLPACNFISLVNCETGVTTEATTESTEATTESTEATTESTEATTESTEATTESTEATTESTEATTESTEATTESTTDGNPPQPNCAVCQNKNNDEDCRCIGKDTPESIPKANTPKLVMISFDDAVTDLNYALYAELFDDRKNPNECPISTTYFVSDANTIYNRVRNLAEKGHEIAVHTISHRTPTTFWASATRQQLIEEIVGMKEKLEDEGIENVLGYRNPFLQTAGDRTFQVLHENGFLYDSTLPVLFDKQYWPYTFDNGGPSQCVINPCPTSSFPGLWEIPMLQMRDTAATCSMFDACHRYSSQTEDGVFEFFKTNFDRHYETYTAPFPLFTHASWMMHPAFAFRKNGFIRFLDYLESRDDVYLVNIQQVIDWMRSPTPLADIKKDSGPLSCPGL
uniref:Chitin-binding type-2 domain-containing protein n=1 Tax=Clytia hemisphaerica TaxID=252671 RepID=A0A7M5ULY8_9CNID